MNGETRWICPLECGWYHSEPEPGMEELASLIKTEGPARAATAFATTRHRRTETALTEHLQSHELVEWVTALSGARQERDRLASELANERQQAQAVREWMAAAVGQASLLPEQASNSTLNETCVHFSEHGWGRCVEPSKHTAGRHAYRIPQNRKG